MLEILAGLLKLEVIDGQRCPVVVLFIVVIVVFVSGVGGQGRKAEVVVDEEAQRQNVCVVALTLTDVRVQLLVATAEAGIVNNIVIEGFPDIAGIDSAIHGAALATLFILDNGLYIESVCLKRG